MKPQQAKTKLSNEKSIWSAYVRNKQTVLTTTAVKKCLVKCAVHLLLSNNSSVWNVKSGFVLRGCSCSLVVCVSILKFWYLNCIWNEMKCGHLWGRILYRDLLGKRKRELKFSARDYYRHEEKSTNHNYWFYSNVQYGIMQSQYTLRLIPTPSLNSTRRTELAEPWSPCVPTLFWHKWPEIVEYCVFPTFTQIIPTIGKLLRNGIQFTITKILVDNMIIQF